MCYSMIIIANSGNFFPMVNRVLFQMNRHVFKRYALEDVFYGMNSYTSAYLYIHFVRCSLTGNA